MTFADTQQLAMNHAPLGEFSPGGVRVVLMWTSTQPQRQIGLPATGLVRFLVSIERLDRQHAMLEAWMETGQGEVRLISPPIVCSVRTCRRDAYEHVDVFDSEDHRLLAMTVNVHEGRLTYAHSVHLQLCGLCSGAFDPPTAEFGRARASTAARASERRSA